MALPRRSIVLGQRNDTSFALSSQRVIVQWPGNWLCLQRNPRWSELVRWVRSEFVIDDQRSHSLYLVYLKFSGQILEAKGSTESIGLLLHSLSWGISMPSDAWKSPSLILTSRAEIFLMQRQRPRIPSRSLYNSVGRHSRSYSSSNHVLPIIDALS